MKRPKSRKKLNNAGSSLVIVIICSMFVSILGMLMLSLTKMNFDMKNTSIKSKDNFYTAENALDELKNGIYENASETMADAYEKMLTTYTSTDSNKRIKNMKTDFVKTLYGEYTSDDSDNEHLMSEDELNQFYSYFVNIKVRKDNEYGVEIALSPVVTFDYDNYIVTFKGVSLSYLDEKGYESRITTDITVECNYPDRQVTYGDGELYYSDFAIINDGMLDVNLTSANVNGNVYSGSGIVVSGLGNSLSVNAAKIITREDITVENKGNFRADFLPALGNTCSIWADNILTKSDSGYTTPSDYISVNANCYVRDDLTLSAKGGNVKISGNYYGYSSGNSSPSNIDGDAMTSSAINVNAQFATLDLSDLSTLYVAGKSYLNVPDRYGSTVKSDSNVSVLMGESVTFKGNQIAYLLPNECISGLLHNPVTADEYQKIVDGEYTIDITMSGKNGGIVLENYLNPVTPYVSVPVRYVGTKGVEGGMFYIYMKFQNADKAAAYYKEYYNRYGVDLNQRTAGNNTGNVILNESIVSTGNALMYNDGALSLVGANRSYNDSSVEAAEINYSASYDGLTKKLRTDYVSDDNNDLTDNLIWFEDNTDTGEHGVIYDSSIRGGYAYSITENANNPYYVCITDKDVNIDTIHNNGLIITTGNVNVNASFTGLIIAKGNVRLSGNATVKYSDKIIDLIKSDSNIYKYFKDYVSEAGEDTKADSDKMIDVYYENWYKD